MKRLGLLVMLCGVGAVHALDYAQKTTYAPRQPGESLILEHASWHRLVQKHIDMPEKTSIHTHLSITPFGHMTTDADLAGRYFNAHVDDNAFSLGPVDNEPHVITTQLIHNVAHADDDPAQELLRLEPQQFAVGLRADLQQALFHRSSSFFFLARASVMLVQNTMGLKATTNDQVHDFSMIDFFSGKVSINDVQNAQKPLQKAKIGGNHHKIGLGDIVCGLGCYAHRSFKTYTSFHVGVRLPTSRESRGEFLFEPLCGRGGHVGILGGGKAGFLVWNYPEKKANVRCNAAWEVSYDFKHAQMRLLSLKSSWFPADQPSAFNQYFLGKKIGETYGQPAANVFTRAVQVRPGVTGEGMLALTFTCGKFSIDAGYSALHKERETVQLHAYDEPLFMLVTRGNDMQVGNVSLKTGLPAVVSDITRDSFDMDAATNPAYITHKLFSSFSYAFSFDQRYPALFGVGLWYETASDNAALTNATCWIRLAASF